MFGGMAKTLHLIYGDDEYMVTAQTRTTLDALVPKAEQMMRLEIVDGAVDTVDAAVDCVRACLGALRGMGLFAAERTVWLRDARFLGYSRAAQSDGTVAAVGRLTELIKAGLPGGITFVISAPDVDKRRGFYKTCKAVGDIHEFMVPDKSHQQDQQAGERLSQLVEKSGVTMSRDVQTAFLGCTGTDTRQVVNEFEKLCVYLGDRKRATKEDVTAVCCATRETAAWDLADAFGKRELATALHVLRRLLFQRESPIGLLVGVESRIRDLLVYREGLERGWLVARGGGGRGGGDVAWGPVEPEIEARFTQNLARDPRSIHPYRAGLLAAQARGFTRRRLHACLKLAIETHESLVSSRVAPEVALERFLVRALSGA